MRVCGRSVFWRDVYEFWLPVYLYEREGKGLNEPFHQITDLLQQENYVRSYVL